MITKYAVIDAGLLYEAARKLAGDDVRDLQIVVTYVSAGGYARNGFQERSLLWRANAGSHFLVEPRYFR